MKLRIVCVGKLKERFWTDAQNEYIKRLSRWVKVEITELSETRLPQKPSEAEEKAALEKEAQAVEKAVSGFGWVVVMAVEGPQQTSEAFSRELMGHLDAGQSVCFVIGGSLGLADRVKRGRTLLGMSKMTLPHHAARVILLEQIYRAFKIAAGEVYHK